MTADTMSHQHPAQAAVQSEPTDRSSPERMEIGQNISPDQEVYCKILLSNILAGTLIGKSGATISSIRQQSGANIRISNVTNSYSPERIALISGTKDAISTAISEVVELGAHVPSATDNTEGGIVVKVIIPKSSVSLLIGKGGQRINDMRQMTGSRIHVATKEETFVPLNERIVKIFGSDVPSVASALTMVVLAIQSDPSVKESNNFGPELGAANHMIQSPGHYGNMAQISPYSSNGPLLNNAYQMPGAHMDYVRAYGMDNWMTERTCEIFMQVPDEYVGALVGKNGLHIAEIKNSTNAKIEISKKGDFVDGTNDRLVTISGTLMSTHAAHARLMKRVMELQHQEARMV